MCVHAMRVVCYSGRNQSGLHSELFSDHMSSTPPCSSTMNCCTITETPSSLGASLKFEITRRRASGRRGAAAHGAAGSVRAGRGVLPRYSWTEDTGLVGEAARGTRGVVALGWIFMRTEKCSLKSFNYFFSSKSTNASKC